MPTLTKTRINATDMMTGVLAVVSHHGTTSLYHNTESLERAFYAASLHLVKRSEALGLNVRFAATPESTQVLPHTLYALAVSGLLTYFDGDICLNTRNFSLVDLTKLPGSPELYDELTKIFFSAYNHATPEITRETAETAPQ